MAMTAAIPGNMPNIPKNATPAAMSPKCFSLAVDHTAQSIRQTLTIAAITRLPLLPCGFKN
jgi:hypothetical protein